MPTAITILCVLTGIAFAVGGFLKDDGRHNIAYDYFLLGFALSGVTILLAIIHAVRTWRRKPKFEETAKDQRADRIEHFNYTPELRKSLTRLKSLSDHLPTDDLGEHYINDYHALLKAIEPEIHQELTPFRIPQSELRRHVANLGWEGAYRGWQISETEEQFCPPNVFRIAISGALKFIDDCLRQIALNPPRIKQAELESKSDPPKPDPPKLQKAVDEPADFKPDELAVKVLLYIYRDEGINPVEDLSNQLNVDPLEIEVRLDKLIERGFVDHNEYALLRGNNEYSLSNEGKEFLLKTPDRKHY